MTGRFVGISHPLHDGMDAYPGLPRPAINLHRSDATHPVDDRHAPGFAIGHLEFVGNVGTYLDSPYHVDPERHDVSQVPLDRLVDLPTTIVDVDPAVDGTIDAVPVVGCQAGCAVLFRTGGDRRWGIPAYWAPFLTVAATERLVAAGPALVGIDSWNIDDVRDRSCPAHQGLLGAGVPIVEHLCHLDLVDENSRTSFVPLTVVGAPSIPVRAFAFTDHPAPSHLD